jgi:hypothetical protein
MVAQMAAAWNLFIGTSRAGTVNYWPARGAPALTPTTGGAFSGWAGVSLAFLYGDSSGRNSWNRVDAARMNLFAQAMKSIAPTFLVSIHATPL